MRHPSEQADEGAAGRATDALIDPIETFTRATLDTHFQSEKP